MKNRRLICQLLVSSLVLAVACDDGTPEGDSGGSTSSTSATSPTTTAPGTESATATSTTDPGESSSGEASSGSSTSIGAEGSSSTSEGSSSTTDGPPDVVPCQAEKMSKARAEAWRDASSSRSREALGRYAVRGASQDAELTLEVEPLGGGFIPDPTDTGGGAIECSVWDQDCPDGEKCAAWANDGGSAWNATRCVPVDPTPAAPGEACTVEGSGVSGIDDCDENSMCWDVDAETNVGVCVALCEGSEAAPTCAPQGTACSISNEGVLILCLPICNPLADECGDGTGCYPVGGTFQCAPDASGDGGEPGDPCQFINACDNGTACINAGGVDGCVGAGCCSSLCVVGDDSACLPGQECLPWFEEGTTTDACLEGIGVCSIPN